MKQTDDKDDNDKNEEEKEDEDGDEEEEENEIIIKRDKNNKQETTKKRLAENDWPDQFLFWYTGMVIVLAESMRLTIFIQVQHSVSLLIFACLSTILSELLTRNNIYSSIFYNYCLKKDEPNLSRIFLIYYGTKNEVEYLN